MSEELSPMQRRFEFDFFVAINSISCFIKDNCMYRNLSTRVFKLMKGIYQDIS